MIKYILTLLSILTLSACTDSLESIDESLTENHPLSVSRSFWNSHFSEKGDPTKFIMDENEFINRFENKNNQKVLLGKVTEQDNLYFITSLYTYTENSVTYELPFYTIVGSKKGEFKVRYNDSLNSFFDAIIKQHNEALTSQLSLINKAIVSSLPNTTEDEAHEYAEWALNEFKTSLQTQNIIVKKK